MKKLNIHLILIIILLLISACSSSNAETNSSNQNSEGNSNWAEENGLNKTESVDELYEKAKEEGKVIVYSRGSKFKDVKNSFEEEYPGVKIESYKMDGMELKEKLTREHGAGVYNADIVHTRLDQNLVNEGYVHPYRPEDIMENYADSYKEDEHPVQYLTINPIIYNTEVYKEPPVNNWWDLTEPEWKGKILLNDPISDATYSELFVSIIQNSDEMAEAYKEKYGKEIELSEENAGLEFIAKLIENDPVLMSSGEDIIDSVGQTGQSDPPIGLTSSSKLRHIEKSGLPIDGIYDMNPRVSVLGSYIVYIADNAPNPNAAKLLARWVMGESDGNSPGLEPFNLYGVWVPRNDVKNHNDIPVEDINAWDIDQEYYNLNFSTFRNFWISKIK